MADFRVELRLVEASGSPPLQGLGIVGSSMKWRLCQNLSRNQGGTAGDASRPWASPYLLMGDFLLPERARQKREGEWLCQT